ncbi:MAG: metallophosphoesterase [Sandaracinus sp.]
MNTVHRVVLGLAFLALVPALAACSGTSDEPASRRDRVTQTESSSEPARETRRAERLLPVDDVPALPPSTYPMPRRLVAIGDVHGDVSAFRQVLRALEAIDLADHWSGGDLFVVQNGDLLDRGDDEPEILALVSQLEREAEAAGGHFVTLNGNHELMNAQLDFRYVTEEGFRDFHRYRDEASAEARHEVPRPAYGRAGAFEPRSHFARQFAARNTVIVVGDTVFVHGGVTPAAARLGLDAVNHAARDFFLGEGPLSSILASEESPIWYRGYALEDGPEICAQLQGALEALHASRMVVGHTVQEGGITHACEGRVFRVDVGLARLYDGPIQALEITAPYSAAMGGTSGTRVIEGSR